MSRRDVEGLEDPCRKAELRLEGLGSQRLGFRVYKNCSDLQGWHKQAGFLSLCRGARKKGGFGCC